MIVITRPRESAETFALDLQEHGYQCYIEPLLTVEPLDFTLPNLNNYEALLFTSANAVRAFAGTDEERNIPVYTVGPQTEEAAHDVGFSDIVCAHGDSSDLMSVVAHDIKKCLHIRGQHVAHALDIDSIIVYQTNPVGDFSDEFLALVAHKKIDAITLFSRRTAESFRALVQKNDLFNALADTKLLCISNAVLECVHDTNQTGTYTAKTPDRQGMVTLIQETCTC